MPNVKSAKKRMRTNERRRLRNRAAKSTLKSHLKRVEGMAEAGDTAALETAAQKTLSVIGKAKTKGIISRNKAARLQSRVQRKANAALAAESAPPETPASESDETTS